MLNISLVEFDFVSHRHYVMSVNFSPNVPGKFPIQLSFFSFNCWNYFAVSKHEILFHFSQAGAHIKNMGGLYIREETNKKDNLRELYTPF